MKLAIFKNAQLQVINDKSKIIVQTLSDNYESIIDALPKSENTKKTYKKRCFAFIGFIQENGINSLSFRQYRNLLDKQDGAAATKNIYLASAKALLKEAVTLGILPIDITANVPSFSSSRKHKKDGLKDVEAKKVLNYIDSIKDYDRRLKLMAMAYLFLFEGFRQMEVQQIKVKDFNLSDRTIKIQGKGESEAVPILIMEKTAKVLDEYINTLSGETYLFESTKKKGHPVTLRYIRKLWTCPDYGIFSKCGFNRSVHGMRHFFTTKTLQITGGDIGMTRRRTRHKTDATVQVYDDRRLERQDLETIEQAFNI